MDEFVSLFVLNNLHHEFLTPIMIFVSNMSNTGLIWIILNSIIILYTAIRYKKLNLVCIVALITLLLGWLLNDKVLKVLFNRPRPFTELEEIRLFMESIGYTVSGASFPSGHSFSCMEQAVILGGMNKKLGCFTVPFALLVAFSRIYLGAHYLTDVITGLCLGLLTAWLANFIISKMKNSQKYKTSKLFK